MAEPTGAVFISYASQDAGAAQRIADALRAAGIEVWFDRSELRGGDVWDRQIRAQIHDCRLFVPVVSANTDARVEGYFRREWKFAVERTNDLSERIAFLVPVVIDSTSEQKADVPDAFRHVQWTRLTSGETTPAFVERIRRILAPDSSAPRAPAIAAPGPVDAHVAEKSATPRWLRAASWVVGPLLGLALAYLVVDKFWLSKHTTAAPPAAAAAPQATPGSGSGSEAAFSPPPHSIAVLPFTNLSGDSKQEYFSDGISEEVINALAHIEGLQVTARTSAFSFKGKDVDIATIARKLNVGAILEGSVRREGNTVRITTQLINAVNGFHIWSEDYDRDIKNLLALQTDIATTVARQLRTQLLGGEAERIEAGGTRNLDAYDSYLRGLQLFVSRDYGDDSGAWGALSLYDRAISLDPKYAAAYAQRARALSGIARNGKSLMQREQLFRQAQAAAERAVGLAPDFADAHVALGWHVRLFGFLDFQRAAREIERAMSLAPGSAYVLRTYASFEGLLGHTEAALTASQRAVSLDPQNRLYREDLLWILGDGRRFQDVLAALPGLRAMNPESHDPAVIEADAYLGMRQPQRALQLCAARETPMDEDDRLSCLAQANYALGRVSEADSEFRKLQALDGDSKPMSYVRIYAQTRRPAEALRWLAMAERVRDPYLVSLRVDWALDPIRNEPEFKALEQRLNMPQ